MINLKRIKTPLSAEEIDKLFERVVPLLTYDHAMLLNYSEENPDVLSWAQAQGDILVDMDICYKEEISYFIKEGKN